MKSSELSTPAVAKPSVLARLASNWIEIFALPISAAIMEAQPLILVQQFVVLQFISPTAIQLDSISIILLLLGLHWWAMFVRSYTQQRDMSSNASLLFSLPGLAFALGLVAGMHALDLYDPTLIVITSGLTLWSWYRGTSQVREGLSSEHLTTTFKIGFAAILAVIFFAALAHLQGNDVLGGSLLLSLPIFFLSCMIALSFTRLATIQQENMHHPGSVRKGTMGSWVTAMTGAWIVIVGACIAFEALPFSILTILFRPVWFILSLLAEILLVIGGFLANAVIFLLAGIAWLFTRIFGEFHSSSKATPTLPKAPAFAAPQQINSPLQTWVAIIIGILVLLAVTFLVRLLLKKRTKGPEEEGSDEEEERETLNMAEILRNRRQERKQARPEALALEALDPTSVRAHYRAFLQSMATKGEHSKRRDSETPIEYQKRLLAQAQPMPPLAGDVPPDPAILSALTQAYTHERYGGQRIQPERQTYLSRWMPVLIQHLTGGVQPPATPANKRAHISNFSSWGDE